MKCAHCGQEIHEAYGTMNKWEGYVSIMPDGFPTVFCSGVLEDGTPYTAMIGGRKHATQESLADTQPARMVRVGESDKGEPDA